MIDVTEQTILDAYKETAEEQVLLLKLEKQHVAVALKISACRSRLVEKKNKLAEMHREISAPLLPVFDSQPRHSMVVVA